MAQYDTIGTSYDVIKTTAFNKLEQVSFRRNVEPLLHPPGTKTVLDLACGTGFYSQRLLEWGAASVVGVDVSSAMVEGAVERLRRTPYSDRSRFEQGDGMVPRRYDNQDGSGRGPGGFDVVTGTWFLNYAEDAQQLRLMFETVAANLKPSGGVFVGICLHPTDDLAAHAAGVNRSAWNRTGVHYVYDEAAMASGLGYRFKVVATPPASAPPGTRGIEFESFHLKKRLYEEAARLAGLQGRLEWRGCEFLGSGGNDGDDWRSEIGLEKDEEGWNSLREYPQVCIMVLRRE
ncbi:hypothetical protein V2A60_007854 [Cordyceps javanica]|uniref:ToxA protein n=1 Tax=Cordyceps javanica TaxID=43265 RepID=A0A545V9L1_9HYPO|nr:toxA protein [Cordyceps javanica]TQW09617.1 toxA protein [Cordyceps javanica]